MVEEWRDVVGFEDSYEVSSLGTVRSKDRVKTFESRGKLITRLFRGKVLSPKIDKDGYKHYILSCESVPTHVRGHRIVASAFIANPLNLPIINHKDNNPANNEVTNLEWATNTTNQRHSYREGRGKSKAGKCFSEFSKEDFDELVSKYQEGYSYTELKNYFGLGCRQDYIGSVLAGERHSEVSGITKDVRRDPYTESLTHNTTTVHNILAIFFVGKNSMTQIALKYSCSISYVSRLVNRKLRVKEYDEFMSKIGVV